MSSRSCFVSLTGQYSCSPRRSSPVYRDRQSSSEAFTAAVRPRARCAAMRCPPCDQSLGAERGRLQCRAVLTGGQQRARRPQRRALSARWRRFPSQSPRAVVATRRGPFTRGRGRRTTASAVLWAGACVVSGSSAGAGAGGRRSALDTEGPGAAAKQASAWR